MFFFLVRHKSLSFLVAFFFFVLFLCSHTLFLFNHFLDGGLFFFVLFSSLFFPSTIK